MNIYPKKNITLNTILAITVTSCGGSGEQSTKASEVIATTPLVTATQVTPLPTATKDLVSKSDFDFISKADLEVIIPTSPTGSINYFINICTDFTTKNDTVEINYNSCKLRTTLGTKEQSFSLFLSSAETLLVAQVWSIEVGTKPVTVFWNIVESGKKWQIVI